MSEITVVGSIDKGKQSVSIDGKEIPAISCKTKIHDGTPKVVIECFAHELNTFLKNAKLTLVVHDLVSRETIKLDHVEFVPR